jgi:hypothetical protein
MPSTVRTTGIINIDSQISSNINQLNSKINSRLRVAPVDIDLIRDTYNLFKQHTHQMYDLQFSAFGNTSPQPTSARTTESLGINGAPDMTIPIVVDHNNHGTFADTIFDLILNFNNFVDTHFHEWDDQAF